MFFSSISIFVVPRAHYESAVSVQEELHKRIPTKNLTILSADHLSDLFSDRRITGVKSISRLGHLAGKAVKHRNQIFLFVILLSLIVTPIMWSVFSLHPDPEFYFLEDAGWDIQNKDHKTLWQIPLQHNTVADIRKAGFQKIFIIDINNDDIKDIIYSQNNKVEDSWGGFITAIDGATRKQIWNLPTEFEINYPFDPAITNGIMRPHELVIGEIDAEEGIDIFATAMHSFYPAVLIKIDPANGQVLAQYDHAGLLRDVSVADLDGDGVKEILIGGTNNAFNQATGIILNPNNIGGVGPALGGYRSSNPASHHEIAYIRFPTSRVHDFSPLSNAMVQDIRFLSTERQLAFHISEGIYPERSSIGTADYIVVINDKFEPLSVGFNDIWDRVFVLMQQQEMVTGDYSRTRYAELLNGIQIWNDDGWASAYPSEAYDERPN